LQTVVEVAAEKNSTLVLPFPVELLRFLERAGGAERSDPARPAKFAQQQAEAPRPVVSTAQVPRADESTGESPRAVQITTDAPSVRDMVAPQPSPATIATTS
jgi:hypothetical protein